MSGEAEPAAPASLPRASVLGTRVTVARFAEAQAALAALVEQRARAYVSPANAYSVTLARDDPHYQDSLNAATLVTADGMSVVWALRCLGRRGERIHNDDLFLSCCVRYPRWRHFLVGGEAGQPEQVAEAMRRRFPGIEVLGSRATPQRPVPAAETEAILEAIQRAQPSVVWVGMGTPAQDLWMREASPRVPAPLVGVGSLFDVLTGRTRPAPEWMKRNGLQWLFRLLQEPRRLGLRYTYYSARFVLAFARQLARRDAGR